MSLIAVLDRASRISDKSCRFLLAVMMTVMVIDVLIGVMNRFIFKFSLSGTEELARFLMVWISMMGGAVALRIGAHVAVTFILSRLHSVQRFILILNAILILAFLSLVTVYGLKLCLSQSRQLSPVLRLSMFWPYLALPVGSILMGLHIAASFSSIARLARIAGLNLHESNETI
jgi:TRAP-type transport system small permease protein